MPQWASPGAHKKPAKMGQLAFKAQRAMVALILSDLSAIYINFKDYIHEIFLTKSFLVGCH